ncbi:MAG: thioredoxin family protein [Bdellovibrionota bacterium]
MERPANEVTLLIGEKAPYFSLPATDGKIYSLSDFAECRALLVVFTCNHCPYSRAYEQRLCELASRYRPEGMGMVAICANDADDYPEDSFEQMVEKSKSLGFAFPYLHDEKQVVARAYDAACTPEAYLFDREMKLAYHGWIDDNSQHPEKVTSPALKNAIEAVLAGQTPSPQLTPVLGCTIKWQD